MSNFKTRLQNRDYSARIAEKHFSENQFFDKKNVASTEKLASVADANYRRLLAPCEVAHKPD